MLYGLTEPACNCGPAHESGHWFWSKSPSPSGARGCWPGELGRSWFLKSCGSGRGLPAGQGSAGCGRRARCQAVPKVAGQTTIDKKLVVVEEPMAGRAEACRPGEGHDELSHDRRADSRPRWGLPAGRRSRPTYSRSKSRWQADPWLARRNKWTKNHLEVAVSIFRAGAAVEQRVGPDGPVLSRSLRGARTRAKSRPAGQRGRSLAGRAAGAARIEDRAAGLCPDQAGCRANSGRQIR
jgi:hypothetical protein